MNDSFIMWIYEHVQDLDSDTSFHDNILIPCLIISEHELEVFKSV